MAQILKEKKTERTTTTGEKYLIITSKRSRKKIVVELTAEFNLARQQPVSLLKIDWDV